jgi:hypothetical protein
MGQNEIFRNAGPDPNTGVVLHMSWESWWYGMCCSPGRLQRVVGDSAILVPEICFDTETENYQISHTDLISGKNAA